MRWQPDIIGGIRLVSISILSPFNCSIRGACWRSWTLSSCSTLCDRLWAPTCSLTWWCCAVASFSFLLAFLLLTPRSSPGQYDDPPQWGRSADVILANWLRGAWTMNKLTWCMTWSIRLTLVYFVQWCADVTPTCHPTRLWESFEETRMVSELSNTSLSHSQGYWNKFVNQFIDGFLTLHRTFGIIKNFSNVLFSGIHLLAFLSINLSDFEMCQSVLWKCCPRRLMWRAMRTTFLTCSARRCWCNTPKTKSASSSERL